MSADVARYEPQALAVQHERSIEEVLAQADKIRQAMTRAMEVDQHYGIIPGARKPSLWKPGAEKLCLLFRLDPQYHSEAVAPDAGGGGHLTVKSVCTLYHIPTGQRFGSGEASCSTRESKYAYRQGKRRCPVCGAEGTINKSKFPPKSQPKAAPGWYCYAKVGGCGQEFPANDQGITEQLIGRVANEDLADSYNTVLKMANKRALVAGILNVTAASDVFTQDLEDFAREEAEEAPATSRPLRQREQHMGPRDQPTIASEPGIDHPADEAPLDVQLERSISYEKIEKLQRQLGYKGDTRARLWAEHVGGDPRDAPLEKLADFEAYLRGLVGGGA